MMLCSIYFSLYRVPNLLTSLFTSGGSHNSNDWILLTLTFIDQWCFPLIVASFSHLTQRPEGSFGTFVGGGGRHVVSCNSTAPIHQAWILLTLITILYVI
jgi:hypothetical protein